jgi:hypothetical protein
MNSRNPPSSPQSGTSPFAEASADKSARQAPCGRLKKKMILIFNLQ